MTTDYDLTCVTCGHTFSSHSTTGFCPCEGSDNGNPCSCSGFVYLRDGQLRTIADVPRPPREDRHRLGLEVVAASEAMHEHDWHRLIEILFGSDYPAHQHAISAFALLAWVASESGDAQRFFAMLRARVLEAS